MRNLQTRAADPYSFWFYRDSKQKIPILSHCWDARTPHAHGCRCLLHAFIDYHLPFTVFYHMDPKSLLLVISGTWKWIARSCIGMDLVERQGRLRRVSEWTQRVSSVMTLLLRQKIMIFWDSDLHARRHVIRLLITHSSSPLCDKLVGFLRFSPPEKALMTIDQSWLQDDSNSRPRHDPLCYWLFPLVSGGASE